MTPLTQPQLSEKLHALKKRSGWTVMQIRCVFPSVKAYLYLGAEPTTRYAAAKLRELMREMGGVG